MADVVIAVAGMVVAVAGLVAAMAGVVAAVGGMGITVVAMDYKETVIIDNHHGWSEKIALFFCHAPTFG